MKLAAVGIASILLLEVLLVLIVPKLVKGNPQMGRGDSGNLQEQLLSCLPFR